MRYEEPAAQEQEATLHRQCFEDKKKYTFHKLVVEKGNV
jgi:hypothetical protein